MKRIYTLSLIGLFSVSLITGCGEVKQNNPDSQAPIEQDTIKSSDYKNTDVKKDEKKEDNNIPNDNKADVTKENISSIKISANEAYKIYNEKYPETALEKLALDKDNGQFLYKIEGKKENQEIELKINADTGEIIKEETKQKDTDLSETFNMSDVPDVNSLLDIAIKDAGQDYSLDEWKLNIDNNTLVLEVKMLSSSKSKLEYKIDAMSGTIIEKE